MNNKKPCVSFNVVNFHRLKQDAFASSHLISHQTPWPDLLVEHILFDCGLGYSEYSKDNYSSCTVLISGLYQIIQLDTPAI